MIQRIQTIFLFLAAASFLALFGFPLATTDTEMTGIFADQVYNVFDHILLIILAGLGSLLALVGIFLFKNRPLQKKVSYSVLGVSLLFIAALFFLIFQDYTSDIISKVNEKIGLILPILSIIFVLLANRFINKDEKLVKSMDRLR